MTINDFESTVSEVYEALPEELRDRFSIEIEEYPTLGSLQAGNPYGYVHGMTPNCIVLCYWVFRAYDDFRREHIERVIKHEFEHVIRGVLAKHSEHEH